MTYLFFPITALLFTRFLLHIFRGWRCFFLLGCLLGSCLWEEGQNANLIKNQARVTDRGKAIEIQSVEHSLPHNLLQHVCSHWGLRPKGISKFNKKKPLPLPKWMTNVKSFWQLFTKVKDEADRDNWMTGGGNLVPRLRLFTSCVTQSRRTTHVELRRSGC